MSGPTRTRVQQSQISGSLDSLNVDLSGFTSGESLTNKNTLLDDLNSLRFQVKSILGTSHWYDGVDQDLETVYGFVRSAGGDHPENAVFQGDVSVPSGSLTVEGAATLNDSLTVVGSTTMSSSLTVTSGGIQVLSGGIDVAGDSLEVTGSFSISGSSVFDGNVEVTGSFTVTGSSTFNGNATVSGSLTITNDLIVSGATTTIDTENLKVKDALIHLNATGSSALTARGIVLHGDNESFDDMAFGAPAGQGVFVLAKRVGETGIDTDLAHEQTDIFAAAELADAKMHQLSLGVAADDISGYIGESESNLAVHANAALKLESNGKSVELMDSTDWDHVFDTGKWAAGQTIVGALNTLYAAGAGGAIKGNLSNGNVDAAVLTFSSLGTLNAVDPKFIDVYLNGVLLAFDHDVWDLQDDSVTLNPAIADSLNGDDVITVILRGATPPA